jgi:hypothetical protein
MDLAHLVYADESAMLRLVLPIVLTRNEPSRISTLLGYFDGLSDQTRAKSTFRTIKYNNIDRYFNSNSNISWLLTQE